MTNPLTEVQFKVPFDLIRAEHVEPAIDRLLEEAQSKLDSLVASKAAATYENTLGALEKLGEKTRIRDGCGRTPGKRGDASRTAGGVQQRAAQGQRFLFQDPPERRRL